MPGDAIPINMRLGWNHGLGLVAGPTKVVEVNFRGFDCFRKVSCASESPTETKFHETYDRSPSIPRLGKVGKGALDFLRGQYMLVMTGGPSTCARNAGLFSRTLSRAATLVLQSLNFSRGRAVVFVLTFWEFQRLTESLGRFCRRAKVFIRLFRTWSRGIKCLTF